MFLTSTLLFTLALAFIFFLSNPPHQSNPISSSSSQISQNPLSSKSIKVFVSDLPRSLNYGLLDNYWSSDSDSRLGSNADRQIRTTHLFEILEQYSAEYWIMGDLMTPSEQRTGSFAKRVFEVEEADVVFLPFFATPNAEMQLGLAKGVFRKKVGNQDYERQRKVVDFVKNTEAWKRLGGRDHVFVLTGYVKT